MKKKALVMAKHDIAKKLKKMCLKGEADRFIGDMMPKHLFAGKRGAGKTDRRWEFFLSNSLFLFLKATKTEIKENLQTQQIELVEVDGDDDGDQVPG